MITRYNDSLPDMGKKPERQFFAKRADANQPSLVKTFRRLGVVVAHLHEVGNGVFDLIIAVDFLNILVEVKDHTKAPSARKLTSDQKKFNFTWTGLRAVATTDFEAVRIVEDARRLVRIFQEAARVAQMPIAVTGCTEPQYLPSLY
jgi:hypothetical protein